MYAYPKISISGGSGLWVTKWTDKTTVCPRSPNFCIFVSDRRKNTSTRFDAKKGAKTLGKLTMQYFFKTIPIWGLKKNTCWPLRRPKCTWWSQQIPGAVEIPIHTAAYHAVVPLPAVYGAWDNQFRDHTLRNVTEMTCPLHRFGTGRRAVRQPKNGHADRGSVGHRDAFRYCPVSGDVPRPIGPGATSSTWV